MKGKPVLSLSRRRSGANLVGDRSRRGLLPIKCPILWPAQLRTLVISLLLVVTLGRAAPHAFTQNAESDKLKEIMQRPDRLVLLSTDPACKNPPMILLHGATDDPTEMMAIAREWKDQYKIYLYCYNYHKRVEKVSADLVEEMKRLKTSGQLADSATVIAFSYGATVFREAVILARDPALFSGDRLIQLVPTAGGSYFARGMENRLAALVISLASKPSAASNPYGSFAKKVWEGEGNEKFYHTIDRKQMQTILVEGDANSLSRMKDENVLRRYRNGIGDNVTVIPKSAGVTHEYFPVEPAGLEYLRKALESPAVNANSGAKSAG